ncbi:MAG: hypothetical protein AAFU64_18780, partial [Bacteroidota bacterium]
SILEVYIYSSYIHPGEDNAFYQQHAEKTAPYVAIIFGIVFFFLVARYLAKGKGHQSLKIGLILPLIYIATDLLMLIFLNVDWKNDYGIFLTSYISKILASYLGARAANHLAD